MSRSFDLKPKGFLSAFMGNFSSRQHNDHNPSSQSGTDDELSRTYHGNMDRSSHGNSNIDMNRMQRTHSYGSDLSLDIQLKNHPDLVNPLNKRPVTQGVFNSGDSKYIVLSLLLFILYC